MGKKRVFILVLDSFGIGAMPDSESFGDRGVNTLASCAASGQLKLPNLCSFGLANMDGVTCLEPVSAPKAAFARLAEASMGKDTTIGHWEIAGIVSPNPLPTYPEGFPEEVLQPFRDATGRGILANAPWSGTEVIQAFGDAHVRTGDLIVYTSADSVFQIAAHEDVVPLEQLYEYCRIARTQLQGKHGVGRVIARPFTGTSGNYTRTTNRHDYSLEPPALTLPEAVRLAGMTSIGVGKIHDIFAGQGLSEYVYTKGNTDGMEKTLGYAEQDFTGLCFVNLVDFDMLYGHRRDVDGYVRALNEFDNWLPRFLEKLTDDDLVIITADHGCDPGYTVTTDHTREYVPVLFLGNRVTPQNLGTRTGFQNIAATAAAWLGIDFTCPGENLLK